MRKAAFIKSTFNISELKNKKVRKNQISRIKLRSENMIIQLMIDINK